MRTVLLGLAPLALSAAAAAQTPITTFRVIEGLQHPVWVGAPPGDERLFVLEQNSGRIRVVRQGVAKPVPFLDIGHLTTKGGEFGLLAMAFDPAFDQTGHFFVLYTEVDRDTVVVRYQVSAGDPDVADPQSAELVIEIDQPFPHHNGGTIAFSPIDGYLYITLGDGGSGGDPFCNAQSPTSLLGKVLRIDVSSGLPYQVPPDNPFLASGQGHLPEIWSVGWRNPWRMAFDGATGDMYLGEVGGIVAEAIEFEPAGLGGRNYGWPYFEGTDCKPNHPVCATADCDDPTYVLPIVTHLQADGNECAMIGGVVYRGSAIPDLDGTYFYSDYCANRIWSLRMAGGNVTEQQERTFELAPGGGATINAVTSFGVGGDGEVYLTDHGGEVFRIVPDVDCDGDGLADAGEIYLQPSRDLDGDGALDLCGGLGGDVAGVSVSAGGTQVLTLDAGAGHGGMPYLLLGTASGTIPGVPIDGFTLPLNVDAYLNLTLAEPGASPLDGSSGLLDVQGRAEASFDLPPGLLGAGAVGAVGHHAYLVFGDGVAFVSNPLPVVLDP